MHKLLLGILAMLVLAADAAGSAPVRVIAFGDSLVHGYGLPLEEGLVPQLNRWLARRKIDAVVTNAGVSGDTTAGGFARISWTLSDDPDVLIILFGGNDLLRGIDPETSRRNLDGILAHATSQGVSVLLIGHEAPTNFGPEYKRDFEAIFVDLARKYGVALFERFFSPLDALGERTEVRLKYMQQDGLHPNAEGIAAIVEQLGPFVAEAVRKAR